MRVALLVPIVLTLGCSSDPQTSAPPPLQVSQVAQSSDVAATAKQLAALPQTTVADLPSEHGELFARDPFQQIASDPARPLPKDTRPRKSRHFPLSELRLVGTVTGGESGDAPRAMLVDPNGQGWVVTRGELVGRSEVVHDAKAVWRVDRITEGDIRLTRQDPTRPSAAPETRVLAIRNDAPVSLSDDREEDD